LDITKNDETKENPKKREKNKLGLLVSSCACIDDSVFIKKLIINILFYFIF